MGEFISVKGNLIKDMGVYLDCKPTYTDHYQYIVDKANRMLGLILTTLIYIEALNFW